MTIADTIDELAALLRARERTRRRDHMPALELEASDGTKLLLTLAEHHREGTIE